MPGVLQGYANHPYATGQAPTDLERTEQQSLYEIMDILRVRTRHDFSGYKKPTLIRRIQRRMGLNQIEEIGEYAKSLRQRPLEVQALSDDLLIHVTGFFRDEEIWEALKREVIVPLVAERADRASIRAWVTACSSGEEAYTLAILLAEAAEAAAKRLTSRFSPPIPPSGRCSLRGPDCMRAGSRARFAPARLERFFKKDDAMLPGHQGTAGDGGVRAAQCAAGPALLASLTWSRAGTC